MNEPLKWRLHGNSLYWVKVGKIALHVWLVSARWRWSVGYETTNITVFRRGCAHSMVKATQAALDALKTVQKAQEALGALGA